MATRSRGWTLQRDPRTGVEFVRFRHAGRRVNRSTGETDRGEALRQAARIYDEVTSSTRVAAGGKAPALDGLLDTWLAAYGAEHSPETTTTVEMYAGRFLLEFRTLPSITKGAMATYSRARLGEVRATTVRKELSALRTFLAWCVEQGVLPEAPPVPSVPKRAIGTPHAWDDGADREKRRIDLSGTQVEAIIAALPEATKTGVPARDLVLLMWETTLRIGTIARIRTPTHYTRGSKVLRIAADIDKVRYAREVPLSPRARKILDRHCPSEPGLVFPRAYLRSALWAAALAVGLPDDDARKVSPHDLRHAAITHLASSPAPIAGIAYLAGQRHISTTARYVHAARSAAEDALAARNGRQLGRGRENGPGSRSRPIRNRRVKKGCENSGLNRDDLAAAGT